MTLLCVIVVSSIARLCHLLSYKGNERWFEQLPNIFHEEFAAAQNLSWVAAGKSAGRIRKAGYGAGNFTFVQVYEAG